MLYKKNRLDKSRFCLHNLRSYVPFKTRLYLFLSYHVPLSQPILNGGTLFARFLKYGLVLNLLIPYVQKSRRIVFLSKKDGVIF